VWVAGPGRSEASGCLGRVTRALGREMGENERNRETGTSHAMWWGGKERKRRTGVYVTAHGYVRSQVRSGGRSGVTGRARADVSRHSYLV